jgi:predicted alpha/beta-fold hydrolase
MGGNVLLKWLGERGTAAPLAGAAAVSVPFELGAAADRLARGVSRVYQRHLVSRLQRRMRDKLARHRMPFDLAALSRADTFRRYDETVTAPLHGFRDAADYYARASCRQYLHAIDVTTLILHARDDPFLPARAIPSPAECGRGVTLEVHARGGHLGFVSDPLPGLTRPWLETRVADFLAATTRG